MLDRHGAEHRHRKNALVQYLSYSGITDSNPPLVRKIITYMNFKHLRSKTQARAALLGSWASFQVSLPDSNEPLCMLKIVSAGSHCRAPLRLPLPPSSAYV